ncbi:hypothetical protein ACFX19_045256 [Malus domestica]
MLDGDRCGYGHGAHGAHSTSDSPPHFSSTAISYHLSSCTLSVPDPWQLFPNTLNIKACSSSSCHYDKLK